MENFELCMSPVETYKAPEIPKFGENNSDLLKKMPVRWQKSAKIITGLGLIGVLALSGCRDTVGEHYPNDIENPLGYTQGSIIREFRQNNAMHNLWYTHGSYSGYSEDDLLVRLHTGGHGSSFYMVHLTEQEAFGIIRARLEAAGLAFGATPPEETRLIINPIQIGDTIFSEADHYLRSNFNYIESDLFDAEKDVGIVHVNWLGSWRAFGSREQELAQLIEERFAEQVENIIVGAFSDLGRYVGEGSSGIDGHRPSPPSNDEVEESRPILVKQLINQADKFIAHLQSEGVLEQFQEITVTINGAPFNTDDYPIIINNQKMVSAIELFDALGMETDKDINEFRIAITGIKKDIEIRVSVGLQSFNSGGRIQINRDWRQDIPVMEHNDIILVPLQFIADFIGATVEWDEDTRTINISY